MSVIVYRTLQIVTTTMKMMNHMTSEMKIASSRRLGPGLGLIDPRPDVTPGVYDSPAFCRKSPGGDSVQTVGVATEGAQPGG